MPEGWKRERCLNLISQASEKNTRSVSCDKEVLVVTRFGPNRVAANMEGNGESDFWVIFEVFWRHF